MTTASSTTAERMPFAGVAVIGFGMVGASVGAAARAAFPDAEVLAVDIDRPTLDDALARGWASAAAAPDDEAFGEFVRGRCELVVIATPVDAAEPYLRRLAEWDFRGVVTDVCSTKARIVGMAHEILPHLENYVPGHPMAGSEKTGIAGARADLFQGAHWILCPDADTVPEHLPRLHEFVTGLGARVVVLPREDHDRAVAVVSHVPHITACSLMTLASRHADDQQTLMRLAAGGFKDSTRIAAGSPQLWCGISFDNRDALLDGLRELQGIVGDFADTLEAGDREGYTRLLAQASEARRALPAAWVPSTERLLEVRIPMANHPGVVAEATAITSSVGCNIQSIEIDHVTEDSAVLSMVLTDEGDIGGLSAKLIDAGFAVSLRPLTPREDDYAG